MLTAAGTPAKKCAREIKSSMGGLVGDLAGLAVRAVHILVVAFVLLAPFSDDAFVIRAHVWLVPFLWMHWILNDDSCALTMLECKLRGVPADESFVQGVVGPVYRVGQTSASWLAWTASFVAWCAALARARQLHVDLRPWA